MKTFNSTQNFCKNLKSNNIVKKKYNFYKKIIFTVILLTPKGNKNAGHTTIDISNYLNN